MNVVQETHTGMKYGPWPTLVVIALGYFMNVLDSTVVNVAIPSIVGDLNASTVQILWVVNGYLLPYAMLLLVGGRLGDIWGHRNVFVVGLSLFLLASLLCGLAQTPGQLIAARVLQGVGAAAASPQALAVITAVFPPARRALAFGVLASVLGSAAAAGPFLGGLITDLFGWRWIFFLNVPIGLLGLAGTFVFVPSTRERVRQHLALVSVLLASTGLFAVLFALLEGQRFHWGKVWGALEIPHLLVIGLLTFAGFVLWERFRKDGLLPRVLFSSRNYSLMIWASIATYFGIFGSQLVMTIYLQSALDASPLQAGLVLSPMWLAASLVAPIGGRLAQRFPSRWILVGAFLLFSAGVAATTLLIQDGATWGEFILPLIVAGAGAGFTFAPLTTVAMGEVPPHAAGGASGLIEMARMIGGAVCTAAIGAILAAGQSLSAESLESATRLALLLTAIIIAVPALSSLLLRESGRPVGGADMAVAERA
jgi:EmrB/QacA subfamily drug resistance transporter